MTDELSNFISGVDEFDCAKDKREQLPVKRKLLEHLATMDVRSYLSLSGLPSVGGSDLFASGRSNEFGDEGVRILIHGRLKKEDALRLLKALIDRYENAPSESLSEDESWWSEEEELPYPYQPIISGTAKILTLKARRNE